MPRDLKACYFLGLVSWVAVVAFAAEPADAARLAVPPPMPARAIAPSVSPPPGVTVELTNQGVRATLFLPVGWGAPTNGTTRLVMHFHTIAWFTIQEHTRRGSKLPLLNFALGEGSATYAKPFVEPARFQGWLRVVEAELSRRGAPPDTRITAVDVSSFSAGYGAVREILKLETNRAVIARIVLCDSLYGGLVDTNAPLGRRQVVPEHITPWIPFAQAAARGEKTFLLTTSDIQTIRYASTGECGAAVAAAVGVKFESVATKSCPAASEPRYPLLRRADHGRFHIWNYGGDDAPAHLTHVRHLADLWLSLDASETNGPTGLPQVPSR